MVISITRHSMTVSYFLFATMTSASGCVSCRDCCGSVVGSTSSCVGLFVFAFCFVSAMGMGKVWLSIACDVITALVGCVAVCEAVISKDTVAF